MMRTVWVPVQVSLVFTLPIVQRQQMEYLIRHGRYDLRLKSFTKNMVGLHSFLLVLNKKIFSQNQNLDDMILVIGLHP